MHRYMLMSCTYEVTLMHTLTHVRTYTSMRTHIHTYMYLRTYVHTYIHLRLCMHVCIHVSALKHYAFETVRMSLDAYRRTWGPGGKFRIELRLWCLDVRNKAFQAWSSLSAVSTVSVLVWLQAVWEWALAHVSLLLILRGLNRVCAQEPFKLSEASLSSAVGLVSKWNRARQKQVSRLETDKV